MLRRRSAIRSAMMLAVIAGGSLFVAPNAYAVNYGEIVTPEQFNTVGRVIVRLGQNSVSSGTGTLIAPNIVLTAAHVIAEAPSPAHISFQLEGKETVTARVLAYRTHPGYFRNPPISYITQDSRISNDIALLRLAGSFPDDLDYYPLAEGVPEIDGLVTAVGYGLDETKDQSRPARRMSGTLRFYKNEHDFLCFAALPGKFQRTDSGDSGGPLLMKIDDGYAIAAIVQGSSLYDQSGELSADEYGFYVSISKHNQWIRKVAQELQAVPATAVRIYLLRQAPENDYLAMSLPQLLALIKVGTPLERWRGRALSRGLSEPVSIEDFKFFTEELKVSESNFLVLDLREKK